MLSSRVTWHTYLKMSPAEINKKEKRTCVEVLVLLGEVFVLVDPFPVAFEEDL